MLTTPSLRLGLQHSLPSNPKQRMLTPPSLPPAGTRRTHPNRAHVPARSAASRYGPARSAASRYGPARSAASLHIHPTIPPLPLRPPHLPSPIHCKAACAASRHRMFLFLLLFILLLLLLLLLYSANRRPETHPNRHNSIRSETECVAARPRSESLRDTEGMCLVRGSRVPWRQRAGAGTPSPSMRDERYDSDERLGSFRGPEQAREHLHPSLTTGTGVYTRDADTRSREGARAPSSRSRPQRARIGRRAPSTLHFGRCFRFKGAHRLRPVLQAPLQCDALLFSSTRRRATST